MTAGTKINFLLFFAFLLPCAVFSQQKVADVFRKAERGTTEKVELRVSDSVNFFFPMSFAKKDFVSVIGLSRIKPEQVQSIELYYTDFPKGKNFDRLNYERFLRLNAAAPQFFEAEHIQWKILAQNNCNDQKCAEDLFHGFLIRKKSVETKNTTSTPVTTKPKISIEEIAKKDPIVRDSLKFWELLNNNTVPTKDSSVIKILTKFPNWKNLLIVNDWTGSMYEFGMEVLLWYKLNESRQKDVKRIVFFNDGDSLPDNKKIIGKTGGIYLSKDSISLDNLISQMVLCMRGGYGGDIPENDVEAMIKGLESCKDCEEVILVADSRSSVRDFSLITQVKKPVHVILCGVEKGVVPEYIKIAYQTGGTIHTIQEDILSFAQFTDGKRIIDFAGVKLIFGDGKLELYNRKKHYKQLSTDEKDRLRNAEKKYKTTETKKQRVIKKKRRRWLFF